MHIDHYTCTYVHAYECLDAADLCLLQEGCWFHIHIVDKGALSLKLHQNQCMCMDFFFQKYAPITHFVYTNAYHYQKYQPADGSVCRLRRCLV